MLSLEQGGPPRPKDRRPLLALMTPGLRSLYDGTVLPLLELCPQLDKVRDRDSSSHSTMLARAGAALEHARTDLRWTTKGSTKHATLEKRVARLEKTLASPAVLEALAESDAPIVTGGSNISSRSISSAGGGVGRRHVADLIGSAAACASSAAEDSKPAAAAEPPNKKKKKKARHAAPSRRSSRRSVDGGGGGGGGGGGDGGPSDIVITLLLHNTDLAPSILELLGSCGALLGVGAASRSLRAAVKASLPRLALRRERLAVSWDTDPAQREELQRQCDETVRGGFPRLKEYPQLRHLQVHADLTPAEAARLAARIVAVGLPARLESFWLVGSSTHRWYGNEEGHRALADLLTNPQHAWPRLVMLVAGPGTDLPAFLDGMLAAPATHGFPRLRSLGFEKLDEATGRKLLALLDRGVFPALTALTPSAAGGRLPWASVIVNIEVEEDWARPCSVLRRLHDTPSMFVQNAGAFNAAWGPFTQLLLDGGLANLKHLSLSAPSTADLAAILAATGAGALSRLEALDIHGRRFSNGPPLDDDREGLPLLPPNSLPSLRELSVGHRATPAVVAGLLRAAGPRLYGLALRGATAMGGVATMARQDFPWLSSIETLDLYWLNKAGHRWPKETREHLALALSRMPALRTLELRAPEYDEVLVRLLVLGEGGRLCRSKDMKIGLPWGYGVVGVGARLLLAFFLKREMKKALEGAEGAVLWEVPVAHESIRELWLGASMADKAL